MHLANDPLEEFDQAMASAKISAGATMSISWEFEYLGFYSVVDNGLTASVVSSPYRNDAFSVLDGTNRRIHIEFEGEYNSPNYVALRGREVGGDPDAEIVINCRRK